MKYMLSVTLIFFASCAACQLSAQKGDMLIIPYGIKINVTDMKKALAFYTDKIGFKKLKDDEGSDVVFLKQGEDGPVVVLNKVKKLVDEKQSEARATLTLQVNNLDSTIAKLSKAGIDFGNY
jgi:predicted enzyme related to lactoylglutathione lyase